MENERWRFLPDTFAVHISKGAWHPWEYLQCVGDRIANEIARGRGRLIVELPPRHGKSELISKYTPAWFLSLFPDRSIILATYEADFATSWGRKVRDLVEQNPKIGITIRQDSSAAHRWETTEGGGMISAGVGGPILGKGGHLLVVDDPLKNWQEAQSATIRQGVIDWFNSTFYTRAEPWASIIVLMTRWHERDLAGYLENEHEDDWMVLRYPALAEENDPLGRHLGEALCPERYDETALAEIKKAVGSYLWAAMFQQRPSPEEGGIWKRTWWQWYTAPPAFELIIQSWDTAFKRGKKNARSCCETWGKAKPGYYLLDVWAERVEYPDLKKQAVALHDKWRPSIILVEDEASGQSLTQDLKRGIDGNGRLPVKAVPVTEGSKETRAKLTSPLAEAGMVHLPERAPWLADFLDEVHMFPNAEQADRVDSMTQALDYLRGPVELPGIRLL